MSQLISGGRLILASNSPRRKEILSAMGLQFEVIPAHVDERSIPADHPRTYAIRCAYMKALAVAAKAETGDLILAADTIVTKEMVIYGKPLDESEAFSILRQLSNRTHQVITGVALLSVGKSEVELHAEESHVTFHNFTDAMIRDYIATGSPMDKAGAYGIQDLDSKYLAGFQGDYTNIVGLPSALVAQMLQPHVSGNVKLRGL